MGLHKVSPNPDKLPFWFDNPTISHYISYGDTWHISSKGVERTESVKTLLSTAETWERAYQVLGDALRPFLCSLFQIQGSADLDDAQFLGISPDEIGLDSLLAVNIRTWWLNTVGMSLSVMKILSGITVNQLITSGAEGLSPDLVPNFGSPGTSDNGTLVVVQAELPRAPHKTELFSNDSNGLQRTPIIGTAASESNNHTPGLDSSQTSDTSE